MRAELLFCAVLIGIISGCGRSDEITRYSIAVSEGPGGILSLPGGDAATPPMAAVSGGMLAAIVPQGKQCWFFKLVGPPDAVERQKEQFESLLKSVRFSKENSLPAWDLPDGWQQKGASGMRFATITIDDRDRQLEITVIPLETMGDLDQYILENVNRWRDQLSWPPVSRVEPGDNSDGSGMTHEFRLSDGSGVTLVDLIENSSVRPVTPPGFDMANHPPIGGELPGTDSAPPDDGFSLAYDIPEGWEAGKPDGMRRAVFTVTDGEQSVEITVSSLPVFGGERLANVNRWRDQIKMEPTTAEQLNGELKKIALAGAMGDYVELAGPSSALPYESILAVLVDIGANTWFFKLKGDASLAEQQRENFQAFVRSVTITSGDEAGEE